MSDTDEHRPEIIARCTGCGMSHPLCQTQLDSLWFVHRLATALMESSTTPASERLLEEYESRWA